MSNLINHEFTMLITSDPSQGASNVSADGSRFEINLEEPLEVPKTAVNCNLSVEEATVWYTTPNIITGVNDKFYIFGNTASGIPIAQLYTVTIPQGLYDLSGLNLSLQSQLEALGAQTTPFPLVSLSGDSNTQKVILRFNYANVTVNFAPADTPRIILGFNAILYGAYAGAPINILAPNIAAFNQINYFLINSDIIRTGLRFNNTYGSIISQVLITAPPGSQIISTPFNPSKIDASNLIGSKRTSLRFWLTNDKQQAINTNGEFYTCRIVIRYQIPY
jgi:hypothetical protein